MKKKKMEQLGTFDDLYQRVIVRLFTGINDARRDNSSYDVVDALKSGFAIYSLKCASLFSFRKRSRAEAGNLKSVFGIKKIPSDNGLRKILDGISPDELRKGFHALFLRIGQMGILDTYRYWNKHLVVSIDGVEHFSSKKVSCKHCLSRKHRDGSTSHHHSMLSAAVVCPGKREVFVLDNEPIVKQDGVKKNDCERNAAKRLFGSLQSIYNEYFMVFVMDALYSCGPIIRQITQSPKWKYIIGITDSGNKALFGMFDQLNEAGKVHWHDFKEKDGHYTLGYVNNLQLNDSCADVSCNLLYCIWKSPKGTETVFSWATNIRLTKGNVLKIMRMGRGRWKIENEVFNTLKNQEYHFEHNFGHGQQDLCTNFAYLMMMAFTLDQIQQRACRYFKALLNDLKTRVKMWESIRAVFKILPCLNMEQVFIRVGEMYQFRLE